MYSASRRFFSLDEIGNRILLIVPQLFRISFNDHNDESFREKTVGTTNNWLL